MSRDPTMVDAFVNLGGDLHSVMAVQVFHPLGDLSLEEFLKHKGENPYKKERKYSKFINFGFCCIPGTLLKTSKGDVPIEKLVTEEGYIPYQGEIRAIDDTGEQIISHTYKTKASDTIEFELEDDSTLEVTPDHNCFVVRERKEIMVKAKEILFTDLFEKFEQAITNMKTVRIKNIKQKHYSEPIDVYCVTVVPNHRIFLNNILTGQCFGKIAPSFAKQDLEPNWTKEEAIQFCKDNKLSPKDGNYFLAAAEFIRNKFFNTYSKLIPWMESLHKIGRTKGVIYTIFGNRRLVPELTYVGEDDDKKVISNLENICVNSPVQTHESVVINRSMRRAQEMFEHGYEENNFTPMESHMNGMTHDAVNWTAADEDKPELWGNLHEIFETDYPENKGVPISYEIDDAHPDDPVNPSAWAFGEEV